jgi:hypothetical protein
METEVHHRCEDLFRNPAIRRERTGQMHQSCVHCVVALIAHDQSVENERATLRSTPQASPPVAAHLTPIRMGGAAVVRAFWDDRLNGLRVELLTQVLLLIRSLATPCRLK